MVPMTVTHMRSSLRGHREIVAAFAERSPGRVQRAIRDHLEEPLRRQLDYLHERHPEAFTGPPPQMPPLHRDALLAGRAAG
jgi:DNA-binding GntR family transcriptional regulator